MSPTLHLIFFSTPANGARKVCSIFITSSVRIGAPFSSTAPSSANSATTVPGNLLLVVAAEWVDPMQLESASARAQIKLVAIDDRHDSRSHAVERHVDF